MKKIIFTLVLSSLINFSFAQSKRILIVMSAADELPLKKGKTYKNTGVFLSELYLAYYDLKAEGYSFEFTTPGGKVSKIDQESYHKKYWDGREKLIDSATSFVKNDLQFNNPITLEKALDNCSKYDALIIPGGQGLMVDLIKDDTLKKILIAFGEQKKTVGLICHAPALLTTLPNENNPFQGYKVNSVTGFEEFFIENFVMKGKPLNRKIGKQLRKLGYHYTKGIPGGNYAVRDRNLVTSQNPFSNRAFTKLFFEALKKKEAFQ